jgi:hypothetical protein
MKIAIAVKRDRVRPAAPASRVRARLVHHHPPVLMCGRLFSSRR